MPISIFPATLVFAAVFLFALIRPKSAIYLPLIFSSAYLVKAQLFGLPSTLLEIVLLAVLFGVWFEFVRRRRVGAIPKLPPIRWTLFFVAMFVISATISAIIAPHPHVAWGYWKALIIEPILYSLTLIAFIDQEKRTNELPVALLFGGLVSVVGSVIAMGFGVDFGRFRGIYDVPNSLALIVAPLCSMSLIGWLWSDEGAHRGAPLRSLGTPKTAFGVFGLVFGLVLIATQSLAGLFAVAITVFVAVIILKKGWKFLLAVGMILLIGLGLQLKTGKLPQMFNRYSSSLIAREQIWYTAVKMIERYPILGTGLGTFEPAYQTELKKQLDVNTNPLHATPYPLHPPLEWVVRDPHNLILSFWLNTGLLGLLAMSALVVLALKDTFVKNTPRMVLGAALVTLLIFGLFDVPYWKNDLTIIWWTLLVCVF